VLLHNILNHGYSAHTLKLRLLRSDYSLFLSSTFDKQHAYAIKFGREQTSKYFHAPTQTFIEFD